MRENQRLDKEEKENKEEQRESDYARKSYTRKRTK